MILQKATYETVMAEQTQMVTGEILGCDECLKIIPNLEDIASLRLIIFHHNQDNDSEDLVFCSWDCVLKHLPKIKTDFFVDLPHLSFDKEIDPRSPTHANRLIELVKDQGITHEQAIIIALCRCVIANTNDHATGHQVMRLHNHYTKNNREMAEKLHAILNPDTDDPDFKIVQSDQQDSLK